MLLRGTHNNTTAFFFFKRIICNCLLWSWLNLWIFSLRKRISQKGRKNKKKGEKYLSILYSFLSIYPDPLPPSSSPEPAQELIVEKWRRLNKSFYSVPLRKSTLLPYKLLFFYKLLKKSVRCDVMLVCVVWCNNMSSKKKVTRCSLRSSKVHAGDL